MAEFRSLARRLAVLCVAILALVPEAAHAQSATTWTGGASSGDWSTAGNWNGGAPSTTGTWALTFGNSAQTSSTNTIGGTNSTVTLSSLALTSNTAVALSRADARTLTLANSSTITIGGTNGITHTVAIPLTLSGSTTVTGVGGRNLQWNQVISGSGSLALNGPTLYLGSGVTNTFSGGVTISSGQLDLAGNSALGTGPLTINGGVLNGRGGARTIANSGTITGNFTFGPTNPITLSGSFDLGGAVRTITIGTTGSAALSGALSNGGITKSGAGQLVLSSAANSYSGDTTVSEGLLSTSGADRIANGSAIVMTGGTLQFGGNDVVGRLAGSAGVVNAGIYKLTSSVATSSTFAGVLVSDRTLASGTGVSGFEKAGAGTLALSGSVGLAADSTIFTTGNNRLFVTAGELVLGGTTTLANIQTRLENGSTLRISGGSHAFNAGTKTGSGEGLTVRDGQVIVDGGVSTAANPEIGFGGTPTTLAFTMRGGSFTVATGNFRLGNNVPAASAVPVNLDGGVLAVNAFSNLGGLPALVFNGGTLQMLGTSVVPSAANGAGNVLALNVGNGGAIIDTGTFANTISQSLAASGSGGLTKLGSAQLTLAGTSSYTGPTFVSSGTLQAGAAAGGQAFGSLSAVTLADAAGATLDLNGFAQTVGSLAGGGGSGGNVSLGAGTLTAGGDNTSTTFAGVISGNGGLTKTGSGVLTLAGANAYSGATTIAAGVLATSAANRIADGSAIVMTGGTLAFGGADTVGSLAGAAGTIDLGAHRITSSMTTSSTFSGVLTGNRTAAAGAGSSGFQKSGAGTLTLDGSVSLAVESSIAVGSQNPLTVAAGELVLAGTTTLTNVENRINGSGAVLRITSGSHAFNSGSSPVGSVNIQNGSFIVDGGLAVVRGMSVGFAASAGATNLLTINGGTLSSPGGAITLGNNTSATQAPTLTLNGGVLEPQIIGNGGSGTSTLVLNGGILRPTAGGAIIVTTTNAGGNLALVKVGNGGAVIDTGTLTSAFGLPMTADGSGGLTKRGAGSLTLLAANSYTGPTTISAGTLILESAGGFANSSQIVVGDAASAGAVLDLSLKAEGLTIGPSQVLSGGGRVVLAASGTLAMAGTFAPGNSPGLFTYDGGTTLLSGTTVMEVLGTSRATGPSNPGNFYDAVNVVNAGVLDFTGGTLALSFGSLFADDTTFDLFTASGGASLAGNFAGVTVGGAFYSGLTWSQSGSVWRSSNTAVGNQSLEFNAATGQLVVVPEPAAFTMVAIGGVLAGFLIRRRTR
jgi:fibronectin-binding autotransporter adhesin